MLSIFLIFLGITSCKNEESRENYSARDVAEASAEFNRYLDEEFEKDLHESPMLQTQLGRKTNYGKWDDFSHLKYAKDLQKAKDRLNYLKDNVKIESLDEQTSLSYKLYKLEMENEIEDYEYRFYDYPINQMFGFHDNIPAFLINMHRIDSPADAQAYIERMKGIPKVFDDVIDGMKLREQNGIMPPKFVFDKVIESSRNIIKGRPFSNSTESSALLADFKED